MPDAFAQTTSPSPLLPAQTNPCSTQTSPCYLILCGVSFPLRLASPRLVHTLVASLPLLPQNFFKTLFSLPFASALTLPICLPHGLGIRLVLSVMISLHTKTRERLLVRFWLTPKPPLAPVRPPKEQKSERATSFFTSPLLPIPFPFLCVFLFVLSVPYVKFPVC